MSRFALAVLSGLLCLAASPPFDLWPLAFVAWAPLFVALHGRTPRQAFVLGGVREIVYYVLGLGWLPSIIRTFGELPKVACWGIAVAIFVYCAGRTALMAWLAARAEERGWPKWVALVLGIAATEAFYPLLFPWYSAIQTQSVPLLMQLAEIGGPPLVGVPLALASVGVAELAWARLEGRRVKRGLVAMGLAAPAIMAIFGVCRVHAIAARMAAAPKAEIAVVQANVPHEGVPLLEAIERHRAPTTKLQEKGGVDLVVWPETAITGGLHRDGIEARLRDVAVLPNGVRLIDGPILTGAILQNGSAITNSAILFAGDSVRGIYDKRTPLVFGEYVPFGDTFPALYRWIPNAGHLQRGTSEEPLVLGDHRITTLICYEDILARETNHAVAHAEPDLLVNLTNDSWFGDSTAALAHLALAKFRAVEHRRYLVHAANSGLSAFVDPTGRASDVTPMLTEATPVGTVRWMREGTIYERVGDGPWWVAGMAVVAMNVARRRRLRVHATRGLPIAA